MARRHDILPHVLFRWRAELGYGKAKSAELAAVVLANPHANASSTALLLQDLLPMPSGMTAFALADGRHVFAPKGSDPKAVQREVEREETAS